MLTKDELAQLRAPFPLNAHTAREGHRSKNGKKIRWFVYIERNEVQDRLEEVFPGEWGTERPELHIQANKVSAVVGITIRGITRWDGGEDDSNEGTKGALTNAFRRTAAYGWHVGRYLYDMDVDIWTESYEQGDWDAMKARKQDALKQFEAWYKRLFANVQKPASSVGITTPNTTTLQPAQKPLETQPDANPVWFDVTVGEAWVDIKKHLLAEKIYANEFEMKNSMAKRGVLTLDNKITAFWKVKLASELIQFLKTRHEEKQPA